MKKDSKTRKLRTDSVSYNVIKELGQTETYSIGAAHGMYRSSEIVSQKLKCYVSPYVLRYLSNKYNGKRVVSDKNLPLIKGVLAGTVPARYYDHLIIKIEESNNEPN